MEFSHMKRTRLTAFATFLAGCLAALFQPAGAGEGVRYIAVISRKTHDHPAWRKVADALIEKHRGKLITYGEDVSESLDALRESFPRYACFVARPEEVSRDFVARVHRLTRRLDDDPYTDVIWGILTGFDAQNALEIARHREPLVIHRVAAGTEVALEMCREGVWYCELEKHRMVRKEAGARPERIRGPADTTRALADALEKYRAQLFVTSGHATERDWQIGFRYRNGSFRSRGGVLYGRDTGGKEFPIRDNTPRVYLPVGNCLMGHIDGPDAMALAFLRSAGVRQMIGYTVPTWYGYAGWGCLDYFLEQPGRYTLAEAFFANQQALLHRLEVNVPEIAGVDTEPGKTYRKQIPLTPRARKNGLGQGDARGLLYDRDAVAFYGDPAWEARMAKMSCSWEQVLREEEGRFIFEIKPLRGEATFKPINTNGSQRGWRPIIEIFPWRLERIEILQGEDLEPLITDNFILIPNPRKPRDGRPYRVVFRAEKTDRGGGQRF